MSAQAKRIALDVVDWLWGTAQGAFSDKLDTSQIITDAVIGMIPVVGDVTAARDLIAIALGLAQDEKKREDKMQWMLLVIFVFALIPVFGGVVKGVGRLALKVTEEVAHNVRVLEEVITFLNRIGHGNAVKWLKELNVLRHEANVLGRFHAFMDTMIGGLARLEVRLGSALPSGMVAAMKSTRAGLKKVRELGIKMIPEAIKELHAKLLRLQQLVYRGEWHTVVPGTRNLTREAEARLIEDGQVGARASAHGGWKQNVAKTDSESVAKIAAVYRPRDGYPDLMRRKGPTATEEEVYQQIAAFSGPINASKFTAGEYMLRVHIPGASNGPWWVRLPHSVTDANWREFMKNGKEWRELLAVLDEFSHNGAFSICLVKAGHSINAWEGKAAEQFGMANAGQYLPGGLNQVLIDTRLPSFTDAVEWVVKEGATGWKDLNGIGYAAGNIKVTGAARVQRLARDEEQSKRPAAAGAR